MDKLTASEIDAYAPAQIAVRVENSGVGKATMPFLQTMVLALLAGAFISFGAMFYTVVITESGLGFGPQRLLGGVAFSLGLILVVVAGAELFTGNNLIVMAWASGKVKTTQILRNWIVVYAGNAIGAVGVAIVTYEAGSMWMGDGVVAATAVNIAIGKVQIPFMEAFLRGILCNALVCLAVWLCFAAHTVSGKILSIIFPISAFVTLGFEHSIANLYFIPMGYLIGAPEITMASALGNLIPVTLGNIVGGGVFVALIYWVVYHRQTTK